MYSFVYHFHKDVIMQLRGKGLGREGLPTTKSQRYLTPSLDACCSTLSTPTLTHDAFSLCLILYTFTPTQHSTTTVGLFMRS